MHVKCALWDSPTQQVISDWHDVEMAVEMAVDMTMKHKHCVIRFTNREKHVFIVKENTTWSGHMITVFPGVPDHPFITLVETNEMPLDDGLTLMPESIKIE